MITQPVKARLLPLADSVAGSAVLGYQMGSRERAAVSPQQVLWVLREADDLAVELGGGAEHIVASSEPSGYVHYLIHDGVGINEFPRREMRVLLEGEPFRLVLRADSPFADVDTGAVGATPNRGGSA